MSAAEAGEFNTATSSDKEERKKNRRKRIEKRNANDGSKNEAGNDSNALGAIKTGQERVAESLFHLDRRKNAGIQEVTSVRVRADENESKRRIEDEKFRHERLGKLQHEALSSGEYVLEYSVSVYSCTNWHSLFLTFMNVCSKVKCGH